MKLGIFFQNLVSDSTAVKHIKINTVLKGNLCKAPFSFKPHRI